MNGKTIGLAAALVTTVASTGEFERMKFNNPDLVVSAKSKSGLATSQLLVRDWNADGRPDLVMGAGDGFFYCLRHEAK